MLGDKIATSLCSKNISTLPKSNYSLANFDLIVDYWWQLGKKYAFQQTLISTLGRKFLDECFGNLGCLVFKGVVQDIDFWIKIPITTENKINLFNE